MKNCERVVHYWLLGEEGSWGKKFRNFSKKAYQVSGAMWRFRSLHSRRESLMFQVLWIRLWDDMQKADQRPLDALLSSDVLGAALVAASAAAHRWPMPLPISS